MKHFFLALATIVSFSLTASNNSIDPVSKKIKTETSNVKWTGKKVTGQHEGTIKIQSGTLDFDGKQLMGGEFTIDMNTITCTDLDAATGAKLDGHLKSDDFFGVPNHPTAHFKIKEVKTGSDKETLSITGDITIKGITETISFDATVNDSSAKATVIIDRTKFGVKYGSGSFFDNLGDKVIYDDFELELDLQF